MAEEFGVSRCELLHPEWMDRKALPSSTGNCIQCLGINKRERRLKRMCVYTQACTRTHTHTHTHVKLDHFAVQQKLTHHYKSV